MTGKIYFISGLGADHRVFVNLKIDNSFQKHIEWEVPFKNESLSEYCQRLLTQIDQKSEVILVGVSFGGIIAQEIAKLISVKKIIIISSVKNEKEMDWKLRLVSCLKLYKFFPVSVLLFLNKFTADYYFGIKSKEESNLLHKIIEDTNPVFMMWAIDRLMKWRNKEKMDLLHLHGTKDKIFPSSSIKIFVPVREGGHFMILNKASEVSALINSYIG
jgi:pimeloyl-ACP methyl ester carboxylesterase